MYITKLGSDSCSAWNGGGRVKMMCDAPRSTYCWTVDEPDDVELCRELGVEWVATNHPGRTKLQLEAAYDI